MLVAAGNSCNPFALQAQDRSATDVAMELRKGACALVLRHAQTEAGIGDPPGFRLDQCSTQRNLSDKGREQAKQIGQWLKAHALKPNNVQSSAWCRCKETADLAFGQDAVLGALNSTFNNRSSQDAQTEAAQTQELRARLKNIPVGQFVVWVTHQVNITALTGESAAMGEAVIVSSQARVLGRTFFTF